MEKKFDEKEFLASVKQLHTITPYLSGNPTAENFIELIRLNCGFDEVEMYSYFKTLLDKNCPELKDTIDIKGWKKVYNVFISQHDDKAGEIMKDGLDFFNSPDQYERYYNLVNETLGIDDVYTTIYLISKVGWIKLVDTLVKMAYEMYPDVEPEKVASGVVEPVPTPASSTELEQESEKKVDEPIRSIPETTATEIIVKGEDDKDVAETPPVKTTSTKRSKRGYNIPVHQYQKVQVFDNIETASVSLGVDQSEILSVIDSKPTTVIDKVWKFTDKTKTKVSLYTHIHSYTNQSDIDKTSHKVCGKKIYHSNVVPQLKDWKPICKSDYVWFQIDCVSIPNTITNDGISENDIVPEEKIDTINTGEELVPNKLYTPANASSGLSPIMKYVGGKAKEMKYILPSLPSYGNYYEPFVGGGSVYMGINANEYYINDLSSDLISLYQCIFSSDEQFFKYIDAIDQSWERANDFSVTNQERLTNLYFSYLNGKISNDDFQFEVALFCEEKEYDILKIVKDSGIDTPVLLQELEDRLLEKLTELKEGRETEVSKIFDNIEAIIKYVLYMNYRKLYNDTTITNSDKSLHAALYLFVRYYSFSGMERYNNNGGFNVSYGGISYNKHSLKKLLDYYQSESLMEHFQKTQIFNMDFEDFLTKTSPTENDFIFLDPPYDCKFNNYGNNSFVDDDHKRLANYLINDCKSKWMMVIGKTDFIYNLYNQEGIYIYCFDKKYAVNLKNRNEQDTIYLMITNYKIENPVLSEFMEEPGMEHAA